MRHQRRPTDCKIEHTSAHESRETSGTLQTSRDRPEKHTYLRKHAGHLAAVEHVVDVLEEALVDDLSGGSEDGSERAVCLLVAVVAVVGCGG
jgi:hypothetical protein